MSQLTTAALIWIDDYVAGDPLFFQTLARGLVGGASAGRGYLLVHGAADRAERLLETQTTPFDTRDGIPVSDAPGAADLIQRAYREANKEIVAVLTEFGVASVGFQGCDRGLLKLKDGKPVAGRIGWLETVLATCAVVVVSATAAGESSPEPIPIGDAVETLVTAWPTIGTEVLLFRRPGVDLSRLDESEHAEALLEMLSRHDFDALTRLISGGIPAYFCDPRTAFDPIQGVRTRVFV